MVAAAAAAASKQASNEDKGCEEKGKWDGYMLFFHFPPSQLLLFYTLLCVYTNKYI